MLVLTDELGTSVDLSIPNEDLEVAVLNALDPEDVELWTYIPPNDSRTSHLPVRWYTPPPGEFRLNRMSWPAWGMGRWASGIFLADSASAEKIAAMSAAGGRVDVGAYEWPSMKLFMQSPTPKQAIPDLVSLRVYALPPRPISVAGQDRLGLYIVPLVDRRYFLQYRSTPDTLTISCGATTWSQVFQSLAQSMKISLTWPASFTGFGFPHPDLLIYNSNAARCLDAAAASIMHRCVAKFDGSYEVMSWQRSIEIRQQNEASSEGKGRTLQAGGFTVFKS